MLGQTISDPDGIEGSITSLPGLGLLPIHTTMTHEKTTQQVTFQFEGQTCHGYEIHQGVSTVVGEASKLCSSTQNNENNNTTAKLGSFTHYGHCIGTYIHGFLDNAPVIEHLLSEKVKSERQTTTVNYADFKEQQYDKLAEHVRKYVDIPRLYQILQGDD
jgi:adenosylcobyric acid synthase